MNTNRKKKGALFLALILIFVIPILITVFILKLNSDPDLSRGTIRSVTLIYDNEEHDLDEKTEVDYFVFLAQSGEAIEEPAMPLSEYRKCEIVFHKANRDVNYVFYLSDSVHNCVYTDSEGKLFLLSEENATKLLSNSTLGGYAISYASYPTLVFTQG
ncbi:MAG: hypothetical protein IKU24_05270, partial [Clostridia bacterium]|nr:hypothetical protein [Clostridia bacterium]